MNRSPRGSCAELGSDRVAEFQSLRTILFASALSSNPLAMDTHGQAQQQKDFMSTFFSPQGDHPNANVDHSQHHQNLFNGQGLHTGMINTGMQALSNISNGSNVTSDIDILQNLMAMQGIESHSPVQANQQAPYNMLEQQFKLTQLQQLQQLQNQIFQQQVSTTSLLSAWRFVVGRNGCKPCRCFTCTFPSAFTVCDKLLISNPDCAYKWPANRPTI